MSLAFLSSAPFWGALSVLASFISLALPWWGIDITSGSFSWGAFWGPPGRLDQVVFFADRLDQLISSNYGFVTSLVVLTSILSGLGSYLKRGTIFGLALVSSLLTDLIFIDDIVNAVATECNGTGVQGVACISGVVGFGASGINFVAWGFKPGFYIFAASGALIITALAILGEEQSKAHPPPETRRPASVPSD